MRKAFVAIGLSAGMLVLSACGLSGDRVVYQYSKTSVLFDYEHIQKVVYTPDKMKLYYCGMELNESEIRCYDAAFEDLGDDFSYSFKNGVLTVNADFADRISGLTIDDANRSMWVTKKHSTRKKNGMRRKEMRTQDRRKHLIPLRFWKGPGFLRMVCRNMCFLRLQMRAV